MQLVRILVPINTARKSTVLLQLVQMRAECISALNIQEADEERLLSGEGVVPRPSAGPRQYPACVVSSLHGVIGESRN